MKVLALALLLTITATVYAENYAVLVAGSNGFWNYRHQSDICHAYQLLILNGYNPDNIITFSFDDVANSPSNPIQGTLYNKPTGGQPGQDVYAGCVIDYKGADVTHQNFLAALQGDSKVSGGKKVLKSTKEDRVFVNFADHGGVGLIAFPNDYLYAKDLHPTFDIMFERDMYKTLVFYLEACESGSMFQQLRTDTRIYAISASSPTESSWGSYCPPEDEIGGIPIGTCLGDLFSVNWLEDTEAGNLDKTLKEQFEIVKEFTIQSEVMQWGDLTYLDEPISNYLAGRKSESGFLSLLKQYLTSETKKSTSNWDSRDNKLMYLINRFKNTQAEEDLVALEQEYYERKYFDEKFTMLKKSMQLTGTHLVSNNNECLEAQVNNFEKVCIKISDYGLKYVKYLAEMCDTSSMLSAHMESHVASICE